MLTRGKRPFYIAIRTPEGCNKQELMGFKGVLGFTMMKSICCYEKFLYPSGVGSAIEYGLNHGLAPVAIVVKSPPGFQDILKHMCEFALWHRRGTNKSPVSKKKLRLKTYLCKIIR